MKWTQPKEDLVALILNIGACKVYGKANFKAITLGIATPSINIFDEEITLNSGREAVDYIMKLITKKTSAPKEVGFNQIPFEVEARDDGKREYELRAIGRPFGDNVICSDRILYHFLVKGL